MKLSKKMFIVFLIAAAIMLFMPYSFRALNNNTTLIGEESYYHARIAQQIAEQGFVVQDDFAYGGRPYFFNLYHYVLALFSYIFGVTAASRLVPFILGLCSVYLLYAILKKLKLDLLSAYSMLGVFVLSPMFTYAFTVSPWCLAIFLNLCGLYLLMKNKKWQTVLAAVLFGVNSLFGITHTLFSAAIVFFYLFYFNKKAKKSYSILALLFFVLVAFNVPRYIRLENVGFVEQNIAAEFISDLGGIAGFSVFALLLALLGLLFVWKYKKKYYSLYAASIIAIVYSFFNREAMVYSNFIIVFLAGIAFSHLAKMRWHLKEVRNLCLVVLFCGILFSAISHAIMLSKLQPDDDIKDALLWLNHRAEPGDKIFSHYSKGYWIEFWADRPVLMDSLFEQSSNADIFYLDSENIFHSNDIRFTQELLSKHKISYVLLTKDMAEGLVWEKEGVGLKFLLSNNETFKKRYNNPCCEIYEYIYEK